MEECVKHEAFVSPKRISKMKIHILSPKAVNDVMRCHIQNIIISTSDNNLYDIHIDVDITIIYKKCNISIAKHRYIRSTLKEH